MYLKRIDIQGFKSFAEKVLLEFEPGITAVVGPNGSGKSNISDAVRWVLGEQSIKTLRGSKMEDVIFSGTENRKPLSFAEVSLILDNSTKALPIEYSEVNISRRIFRSGESEYYINKSSCRLKDIYELFMDTGVGRDGYSIIGQGRIDEILSSKSEDRRNIFEEAAGIMKYKTRKVEAERKLESTKQNLLRVNDIICELELQLDPLKEQSEKAKKYLELAENLKVLDVNLFIENYSKLKEKLESANVQFNEVKVAYEECAVNMEQSDVSYNSFSEHNKELENQILSLNTEIFEIEKQIEKINSEIELANEKILNHKSNKERIQNDISGLEDKEKILNTDIENRNDKMNQLNILLDEANKSVEAKENEATNSNQLLEECMNQIEDQKGEVIEKYNQISAKKGSANSINVLIENIDNRKIQISNEANDLDQEKKTKNIQIDKLQKSISDTGDQIEKIKDSLNELYSKKESIQKELSENFEKSDKLKEDINKKTSRHSLLSDMDKEYEGFSKSVKSILQECQKSLFGRGVHGALVQLINVPKKYETAIDVALGGALQNIVTDNESDAQKVIEYLKTSNLGRATFLPLSSVKARSFEGLENELSKLKGNVGIASNLIQFDKKYSGIIENLLGKVLVVDSIENGITVAKKYNYSFKIVTLEGEVLNQGGSISGGSVNKSTSLISRSREIEELAAELVTLKKSLVSLNDKNIELNGELVKTDVDIENKIREQKEKEINVVGYQLELNQNRESIIRIEEKFGVLNIETKQLDEQKSQAQEDIERLNKEVEELLSEIDQISKSTAINQEKYKRDIEKRDKLIDALTEEKVKVSGINQEILGVKENIDRVNGELLELKSLIEQNLGSTLIVDNEIFEQGKYIESKSEELKDRNILKDQQLSALSQKTQEKSSIENQIEDSQKAWKKYNASLAAIAEEKGKVEIKITKYEMELDSLQNRIWEDYQMTYTKCLEFKTDISNFGNPNKAINQIKGEINALGTINVSAIEEYAKVKERFEFLSEQKTDLEEAEKSLRKVIADMVHTMKKQFIEQFQIINTNFNEVFKELFGGGRAYLKLTDEENVLECGIDIEAQPPGKKLQNLTLLSGGERALTAIAILFAMLRVRPTPFCILDEIEAALDDVNVVRFAEYIKKYAHKTQFLIITHRKDTMEVADSIYGVTMQEHGISKLVSIKMSERAS